MNRTLLILGSLFFYLLSFLSPALTFATDMRGVETWSGIQCASLGMFGAAQLHFEFFANVFYVVAIGFLVFKSYQKAYKFSFIAIVLSLQTLLIFEWPIMVIDTPGKCQLLRLESGFYLWILSFVMVFLFSNHMRANEETEYDDY